MIIFFITAFIIWSFAMMNLATPPDNFFNNSHTTSYLVFCSSFFSNFFGSVLLKFLSILSIKTFMLSWENVRDNFYNFFPWFTWFNPHILKAFSKFVSNVSLHTFNSLFKSNRRCSLGRFLAYDSFHQFVNSIFHFSFKNLQNLNAKRQVKNKKCANY